MKIVNTSLYYSYYLLYWEDENSGWNDMTIVCRGTSVKTYVNNFQVTDFDGAGLLDNAGHKAVKAGISGHFALQLHMKDENKIWFKDIEVRELK